MKSFETQTKAVFETDILNNNSLKLDNIDTNLFKNGLTACAGIAFIKESYPFYYGYNLAEALCGVAKKEAKEINRDLAPSCLMFHKVQDSFVENYSIIKERELTPQVGISYKYGPYYLAHQDGQPNKWTIENFINNVRLFEGEDGNALKSSLRNWMTILQTAGIDAANQRTERIKVINNKYETELNNWLNLSETPCNIPVYDMLVINSVMNQITK